MFSKNIKMYMKKHILTYLPKYLLYSQKQNNNDREGERERGSKEIKTRK